MPEEIKDLKLEYSLYAINDLKPGDHLCFIYRNEEEHRQLIARFLKIGLEQNEKIIYIRDSHESETILNYLIEEEVDVKYYQEKDQFCILFHNEVYTKDDQFDPEKTVELLRLEAEKAVKQGFSALRVLGEMTWVLRGISGSDRLIEYEILLNNFFSSSKCLFICQYDKRRFPPTILIDIIHIHPIVVYGTKICDNPFYIPANPMVNQEIQSKKLDYCLHFLLERRQLEEVLKKSNQHFYRVINQIAGIIWAIDRNGVYIFLEGRGLDLIGLKSGELVGKSIFDVYSDNQQIINDTRRVLNGESFYSFSEIQDIMLENRYTPLKDTNGMIIGASCVAMDVTDVKQMLEALIESESKYRHIVENVPTGICEFDLNTYKFKQMNDLMCKIAGWSKEELYSMNPTDIFVEDSKKHFLERIEKMKIGEKVITPFEYKIKTKQGRELWVLAQSKMIYEEDRPNTLLTIIQDITERKQLEKKLWYTQKMETISTLAGGIAHEFNNALMILSGSAETLQMRLPKSEGVKKFGEIIYTSIQRMVQLTDQLLAYARGGKYEIRNVDIPEFIRASLPVIQHIVKKNISIETDLPKNIYKIEGDPTQLQMVLSAIIQNASDAIQEQGRIRVVVRNEEINEESIKKYPGLKAGLYVSIGVKDDGIGMTDDTISKIFEPFFTTKIKASGLSMSAVYGIVKNHEGYIDVESKLGEGSTIRIFFPANRNQIENENPFQTKVQLEKKGTILIVDHDEILRAVSKDFLEVLNYIILEAMNEQEAVKILSNYNEPIDLVLLSIDLPHFREKNIYSLFKKIRPNLKIIVCSGDYPDEEEQSIINANVYGFLKRPFTLSVLEEKLNEILKNN